MSATIVCREQRRNDNTTAHQRPGEANRSTACADCKMLMRLPINGSGHQVLAKAT
jgi:hypothetical protein